MRTREHINDTLKAAMKAGEKQLVSTLRLINAAIKDADIASRTQGRNDGIDEAQITELLVKMVKRRHESIELYEKGGRLDLAEGERAEIGIIQRYLPEQLSEAETETIIADLIRSLGASTIKDMGKIIAALKTAHAGRIDMAKAGLIIKRSLG